MITKRRQFSPTTASQPGTRKAVLVEEVYKFSIAAATGEILAVCCQCWCPSVRKKFRVGDLVILEATSKHWGGVRGPGFQIWKLIKQ